MGTGWYIDLHIQVIGSLSVVEGHKISGEVEQALYKNAEDILDVVVHLEPLFEE